MLPAGGRLVAITSAGCIPADAAWNRAFERLDPPPRTVFSIAIDGRAYARRGTTFDTRLTVIDRANASGVPIDARAIRPHRRRVACSHRRQCAATAGGRANCPRRHCRPAICSAMPPHGRPHESAQRPPRPTPDPQPRKSAIGGRWPNSTTKLHPPTLKARQPNRKAPMPGSTSPGIPGPRAFPARPNIQRRWCNPPPWRRCPIPCRRTARCCRCVS